jgi:subtilisin family serine protease
MPMRLRRNALVFSASLLLAATALLPYPLVLAHRTQSSSSENAPQHAVAYSGAVVTEALNAIGALPWHQAGYLGQGVRVGVMDRGFSGYAALLGIELPATVRARCFVDGQGEGSLDGGTPNGTAMAEIVHDVAPAAELYLVRIETLADLTEAVDWLLAEGVQVVVTSVGWYNVAPGDGTGLMADQVARARAGGMLWVAGAGDVRRRHWCGDWIAPEDGDSYRFGFLDDHNDLILNGDHEIPAGTRIDVLLRWSDWDQVDQDYDLYLWAYRTDDQTPHVVASSMDPQTGQYGQAPVEGLSYITGTDYQYYTVQIRAYDVSRDVHLDLFVPGDLQLQYQIAAQSLSSLADAAQAVSVGAVHWEPPYRQTLDSSEGPTKGPGGIAPGGRRQPGLAGYSDVTTASIGHFVGTAAAASHVAGAAALVKSRYPGWGPAEVETLLYSRARDNLWPPGWDSAYGYGSLYIGDEPLAQPVRLWLPLVAR